MWKSPTCKRTAVRHVSFRYYTFWSAISLPERLAHYSHEVPAIIIRFNARALFDKLSCICCSVNGQ